MRFIRYLISISLLMPVLLAGWMLYFTMTPLQLPAAQTEVDLKAGSSLRAVSRQLVQQGVLSEPWSFMALVRLTGKAGDIKAGNYVIADGTTPYALFEMLTNGDTTMASVTFIEGWTFDQMRTAMTRNEAIKHVSMGYTEAQILAEIGGTGQEAEGLFFPDTYYFSRGMTDIDILKRAYHAMQTRLAQAWEKRAPGLPYATPYEALIMASIVEKETGRGDERPMIAGVFVNRLRIGMRLQTDPTVIYGMGERFDGNLRRQDLLTDTPYNTYTRANLPPTPIAMPGLASIEAALHPAQTKALYFVGKGDGSHAFSSSLAEHNRAVARYQLRKRP
ncbi:endolytic transglycosylase MltG [Methylobacillus flagellatus]|uniref:endolytic transglycosylase MltG n=1 Tax=Methylobacillus flagellatus TaxID=405 RepID=UPI0010F7A0FE|nr:endolytic transglycosylase MltG [Methylobacillus flagellatus]